MTADVGGSSGTGTNPGGGGTGGNGTGTNSSTGGGGSGIMPNPSFGPTSFDNGVSSLQFPQLIYIVSCGILLLWFKM